MIDYKYWSNGYRRDEDTHDEGYREYWDMKVNDPLFRMGDKHDRDSFPAFFDETAPPFPYSVPYPTEVIG